jgi:DNA polymerase-4
VGPRISARLADLGIHTVAELAATEEDVLVAHFGPANGAHVGRLGRGGGRAWPDDTPWVARAHGHETTYQRDLDPAEVPDALRVLAEQVADDLRREERPAMRVHLKVRVKPFFTSTKVRKLPVPTYDAGTIAATALELYLALGDDRPVRLLGIRGEMVPPEGGY